MVPGLPRPPRRMCPSVGRCRPSPSPLFTRTQLRRGSAPFSIPSSPGYIIPPFRHNRKDAARHISGIFFFWVSDILNAVSFMRATANWEAVTLGGRNDSLRRFYEETTNFLPHRPSRLFPLYLEHGNNRIVRFLLSIPLHGLGRLEFGRPRPIWVQGQEHYRVGWASGQLALDWMDIGMLGSSALTAPGKKRYSFFSR